MIGPILNQYCYASTGPIKDTFTGPIQSDIGPILAQCWNSSIGPMEEAINGPIMVWHWANTGPMLEFQHWANGGGHQWANNGLALGQYWSNAGSTIGLYKSAIMGQYWSSHGPLVDSKDNFKVTIVQGRVQLIT